MSIRERITWAHARGFLWSLLPLAVLAVGQNQCEPCTDADGDGYCVEDDCDDNDPNTYPHAAEICDQKDNNCDFVVDEGLTRDYYPDADGDGYGDLNGTPVTECAQPEGYARYQGDCDDTDQAIRPDAIETPNEVDDDCDGLVDEDTEDADGDGFTVAAGDCDDLDALVYPGAEEVCDNLDNDCDGAADDGLLSYYYRDEDLDGFGTEADALCASADGYVARTGDCDDTDPTVYPGADDAVDDGIDQDCGGTDGPQPHVGLSEASFATIQEAIDAADAGDIVWVGPGLYFEHDLNFAGKALTLAGTDWASTTTIDADGQGRVMTFNAAETADTVVRRFTLSGGYTDIGGAIYTVDASPVFERVIIQNNLAGTSGGGFYVDGGTPRFVDSIVANNRAENVYGGGGSIGGGASVTLDHVVFQQNDSKLEGGGISVNAASATLTGCVFLNNKSISSRGGGAYFRNAGGSISDTLFASNASLGTSGSASYGGGLYLDSSTPAISQTVFRSNNANYGAGLYLDKANADLSGCVFDDNNGVQKGGAIYLNQSTPTITNCLFRANKAESGAGLYLFESNPTMLNNLLQGNLASKQGGAMYLFNSAPRIFSAVMTGNAALNGGAMYLFGDGCTPHIENSVFAYNSEDNIYLYTANPDDLPLPEVIYTDLYNPEGSGNHNITDLDPTNLLVEPGFLGYDDAGLPADFHLSRNSPLVDVGLNFVDVDGSPIDLGLFGGAFGDDWDMDGDGYVDYFWAGLISNAPEGYEMTDFDRDDQDPSRH